MIVSPVFLYGFLGGKTLPVRTSCFSGSPLVVFDLVLRSKKDPHGNNGCMDTH